MNKPKGTHTLPAKMLGMILLSTVVATLVIGACLILGRHLVDTYYRSPKVVSQRLEQEMDQFQSYVLQNGIESIDMTRVESWNLEHQDVCMTIYGANDTIIISDRFGASRISLVGQVLERACLRSEAGDTYDIAFADGVFMISVYEYPQDKLYSMVNISAVVLGAAAFLAIMLVYVRHITNSVRALGRQVRQVSRGQLQSAIHPTSRDEIGELAADVDTMRLSIIDKLQREEQAWQANAQLIAALSHDIRTPLTALMGYLDVLSDEDLPEGKRQEYLDVCVKQAGRLKDLTNEMLGFFLVYGRSQPTQTLERFDARMLLEQLLGELLAPLREQGYDIRHVTCSELTGCVTVDLGHLRRVFDKLFSNLLKYADKNRSVTVLETVEDGTLHVCVSNYIPAAVPRVESTKMGLATCRKLMEAMGGGFTQRKGQKQFTAEVMLPLSPAQGEPD